MSNLLVKHNCSFFSSEIAPGRAGENVRSWSRADSQLRLHRESWIKCYNYDPLNQHSSEVIELQNKTQPVFAFCNQISGALNRVINVYSM